MARKSNLCWPDGRGWIGIGIYILTLVILFMMWQDKDLRKDDFFQSVAILIVGTGFVNGVVSWAYSATQSGGDLAQRNQSLVENVAAATAQKNGEPQEVKVINAPAEPVPTETSAASPPAEDLPDYARG